MSTSIVNEYSAVPAAKLMSLFVGYMCAALKAKQFIRFNSAAPCVLNLASLQNMPNVRDHDASVYLRLQGDALSVGGYEENPIFWDEVSLAQNETQ